MSESEHVGEILNRALSNLPGPDCEIDHPMRCPYCNFDYVHLEALELNRGGQITAIDHTGTTMRAGEASGRGARVALTFWCESGHRWLVVFQFHKGQVFIEKKELCGCDSCRSELWRD